MLFSSFHLFSDDTRSWKDDYFEILLFQARHNGQNYVFSLLTGYRDPPAGVAVSGVPSYLGALVFAVFFPLILLGLGDMRRESQSNI